MTATDQMRAYAEQMGDEALIRQYVTDGRERDGKCPACGVTSDAPHRQECERRPRLLAAS